MKRPLTPEILASIKDRLGKALDTDLAKETGVCPGAILKVRKRLGVLRAPPWNKKFDIELAMDRFGVAQDNEIASEFGVSRNVVWRARQQLRIESAPPRPQASRRFDPSRVELGTAPDRVFAEAAGVSTVAVGAARRRLGIAPFLTPGKFDVEAVKARLGKETDEALAREFGVSRSLVSQVRRKSGIPQFRAKASNACSKKLCHEPRVTIHYCDKHRLELNEGRRTDIARKSSKETLAEKTKLGLCTVCITPVVAGRRLCQDHLEKRRTNDKRQAALHKQLGLCTQCKEPFVFGKTLCKKHLERFRSEAVKRKATRTSAKSIAQDLVAGAKFRAKQKKMPFSLDVERIQKAIESGVCEVTGLPFDLRRGSRDGQSNGGRKSPWSPSLDRRVPASGYTNHNTRVVVWIYNISKFVYTDADVLRMSRAIVASAAASESP